MIISSKQVLGPNWEVEFTCNSHQINNVTFGIGTPGRVLFGIQTGNRDGSNIKLSSIYNTTAHTADIATIPANMSAKITIKKDNNSLTISRDGTIINSYSIDSSLAQSIYVVTAIVGSGNAQTLPPNVITIKKSDKYCGTTIGSVLSNTGVADSTFLSAIVESARIFLDSVPVTNVRTNYLPPGPGEVTIIASTGAMYFNPIDIDKTISGSISYIKYPD